MRVWDMVSHVVHAHVRYQVYAFATHFTLILLYMKTETSHICHLV